MTASGSTSARRRRLRPPTTGCSAGPARTTSMSETGGDDGRRTRAAADLHDPRRISLPRRAGPRIAGRGAAEARAARATVLLPNRRACRALGEAMLRASPERALLLPGDPADRRYRSRRGIRGRRHGRRSARGCRRRSRRYAAQLLLAELIRAKEGGEESARIAGLAFELARLLDQMETEGARFRPARGAGAGDARRRTGRSRSISFASSPRPGPRCSPGKARSARPNAVTG